MSFRVKLRIKSVNPCYPVKPAPASPNFGRPLRTNQELLDGLYEAAKRMPPLGPEWVRRFDHGNLTYRGPNTCFLWNGVAPINHSAVH